MGAVVGSRPTSRVKGIKKDPIAALPVARLSIGDVEQVRFGSGHHTLSSQHEHVPPTGRSRCRTGRGGGAAGRA